MYKPKIKICGLSRPQDIELVNILSPDYIGFVFANSRRKVVPAQAQSLSNALSGNIIPVGVFVDEPIKNILSLVQNKIIAIIQLHGAETESYIKNLKQETNAPIIKAISVQKAGDVQKWANTTADYLLLDHKGGGTGKTFDWGLIGETTKPFFLAGGLTHENVSDAINKTTPYAVDVSSSVEQNGVKSLKKIQQFIRVIRDEI